MIGAISKKVFRIFDCAEYLLFKTLLYFLGLVGLYTTWEVMLIKVLLRMLARLPWGRKDMLGSMNGKHRGVSVKHVSL